MRLLIRWKQNTGITKMIDAVVYSKDNCPWCIKAINLLQERGLTVKELKLGVDYQKEELRVKLGGVSEKITVPQIFIDGELFGNYDALEAYLKMSDSITR